MANTTLCGYVSYGTNVEKNEDDSELYLDCQINLDNNGTEKNTNSFPTKDAVLNGIELILDDSFHKDLEDFLDLTPQEKDYLLKEAESFFKDSKNRKLYKNLPDVKNEKEAIELGKKAVYNMFLKELTSRKVQRIMKKSGKCVDDVNKLLNSDNINDKTVRRLLSTIKNYDSYTGLKIDKEIIKLNDSKIFKHQVNDSLKLDTDIKKIFGKDISQINFTKNIKINLKAVKPILNSCKSKGNLISLAIGVCRLGLAAFS